VTHYVTGNNWVSAEVEKLEEDSKFILAASLIDAVKRMHDRHIAHGDIHPGNIILDCSEKNDACRMLYKLTLIDSIDFGEESEPYNVEYGPKNPAAADSFGRDRFAVYKLVKELFGNDVPVLVANEIDLADKFEEGIPPSLLAIENALIAAQIPEVMSQEMPTIDLAWGHHNIPESKVILEQDEESYYFNFKWDRRQIDVMVVYITGVSEQLQINVNVEKRRIERVSYKQKIPLSEVVSASSKSCENIEFRISLQRGQLTDIAEKAFVDKLMELDSVLEELVNKYGSQTVDEELHSDAPEELNETASPMQLWQALATTEAEILQSVEVDSDEAEESKSGSLIVPYININGLSLNFEEDDKVFVSVSGDDSQIAELSLMETNLDVLAIRPTRQFARKMLSKGVVLSLESVKSKASRDRRLKALSRVASHSAVIANLPDYFDPNSNVSIESFCAEPTEKRIRELYDTDNTRLNPQQINAFKKLMSYGPVGVLQGPPGTGKTAFISKFIHYLFGEGGVKNVLLVGQSHSAVDNVAIKVREVCISKGLDLSLVRIGHEKMINDELLHAHPSALQRQIRQKFHREYDLRIKQLASRLLLPLDLVSELAALHRTINPLLTSYSHLMSAKSNGNQLWDSLDEKLNIVELQIDRIVTKYFFGDFEVPYSYEELWNEMCAYVGRRHGINNPAAIHRLKILLTVSQDWMDVLRTGEANYDKFMVKTKQLVCGTLVGLGLKKIEIENAIFDWVIVDEAGRAQASELLIALQSAKRILLVGDQKQLPPYYDKTHLKHAARKLNCDVEIFQESDFYKAFKRNKGVTLDTQYRMVKPIGDVVSKCFYSDEIDELKTGRQDSPEWYKTLAFPWNEPVTWIDSHSDVGISGEEEIERGKYVNASEVSIIKSLFQLISDPKTIERLTESVSKEQPYPIGIITMYRAQKDLIENEISKYEWATPIRHLLKIDTVDSYQGQENKIIILSLVRDNDKTIQGFLGDAPRINVAISRAQERLIILGAKRMWSPRNNDSALGKVFEFILDKVGNGDSGYQFISAKDILGEHKS